MQRHRVNASEQGAMTAVVGMIGASVLIAALLVAGVTQRVVDRARAQAAADAAALAGVVEGQSGARVVAEANDADLIQFVDRANEVSVTVAGERGVQAHATAERRLEPVRGG